MVMRIVNEFPVEDRGIAAVIYPLGPKTRVPAEGEDPEADVQAKVVRAPHRKTPRATEGAQVK